MYRVDLAAPRALRVMAIHGPSADLDLVWLTSPTVGGCTRAADVMLRDTFPAGTHYFAVDASSASSEGDIVFLAAPCDPADDRCAGAPQ